MLHKLYKSIFFSTSYKYNGNDRINLKNRRGKTNLKIMLIKMKKKIRFSTCTVHVALKECKE